MTQPPVSVFTIKQEHAALFEKLLDEWLTPENIRELGLPGPYTAACNFASIISGGCYEAYGIMVGDRVVGLGHAYSLRGVAEAHISVFEGPKRLHVFREAMIQVSGHLFSQGHRRVMAVVLRRGMIRVLSALGAHAEGVVRAAYDVGGGQIRDGYQVAILAHEWEELYAGRGTTSNSGGSDCSNGGGRGGSSGLASGGGTAGSQETAPPSISSNCTPAGS